MLLLVTIAAALQMPNLRLEISAEGMMVKDDPARLAYEQSLDTFGVDNVTIVYLEDDELFSADNLRAIKKVVQVIESSDLVSHTESLFSIRHLRMEGEFLYTDAYLAKIPESAEAITAVRQAAFGNPLIADNLLSADGRVMAINISLNSQLREAGFDEAVAAFLNDTLGPLENRLERVFFLGDPSVRVGINDRIHEDQKSILPISLAILIVTLAITLRRISGALIPLMTASLSVIWTLGLMAALDIPLNVMTSIVPALLIIIGSTEDIHLLSEYLVGINKQYDKPKALKLMSRNMSMAVLLTFITTYFGFLSIALNSLDILQQFGLVASTGLLLNFLITISLVPLALKWFGSNRPGKPIHDAGWLFTRISLGMLNLVERFRYAVVGFLTVVFLIGAYGATQVNVNNNVMDYFKDDSALAKKAQLLHDNLAGMQTFSIILSGTEDTFTRISRLDEIWELQEYIAVAPGLDKSVSFADFLAVIHTGLDGEGDGELYLPDEDAVVMEYMALVDKDAASSLVSENFSQARITVRHNIDSSMELNRAVEGIYAAAEELISEGVRVSVTGESYLSSMAVDYIADGQVRSLLMMLLVIFGIVAFLFMNPKAGWVAVVANAFPIVMLFGFMGYAGLSMDTGTAMVGAISLG
ncbi:MAG: efflux RND transporter permease subunit, partial [bacterium]